MEFVTLDTGCQGLRFILGLHIISVITEVPKSFYTPSLWCKGSWSHIEPNCIINGSIPKTLASSVYLLLLVILKIIHFTQGFPLKYTTL